MLFSNDAVASFVNNNFEPAWECVRPVPLVHIDFGNQRGIPILPFISHAGDPASANDPGSRDVGLG